MPTDNDVTVALEDQPGGGSYVDGVLRHETGEALDSHRAPKPASDPKPAPAPPSLHDADEATP